MKGITKPIWVLKQTSAIYFFKIGIFDFGMTKMKCQNKRQNKTNFDLSFFRRIYRVIYYK
jgi:hypothetical protein